MEAYQEEQAQRKTVGKLTGEREAIARDAAKQVAAARETYEELKVKEVCCSVSRPRDHCLRAHAPHHCPVADGP